MLVLILVLLVIAMVICIIVASKTKPSKTYDFWVHTLRFGLACALGILAFLDIIAICFIIPNVATSSTIDDKIALCQEENQNIV